MNSEKTVKHRIESDFIGEVQIPNDAYYGINTLRGYENFNINDDKTNDTLIKTMIQTTKIMTEN